MPSLPPELVHLPFEPGPYRMAMGLFTVPERDWFEIDALYPNEMAERRRLLASLHPQVFAALPQSAPARREALSMIASALRRHHPDWFAGTDAVLHNHLTSEAWDLEAVAMDPLEPAAFHIPEVEHGSIDIGKAAFHHLLLLVFIHLKDGIGHALVRPEIECGILIQKRLHIIVVNLVAQAGNARPRFLHCRIA